MRPHASLRVHHRLVGAPRTELEQLRAGASPALRAVLERANGLAHHRLNTAAAIEAAIARHQAPPFFEHELPRRPVMHAQIGATDLCRALLALHPRLWDCFASISRAKIDELHVRWRELDIEAGESLPLQPALARRLSWRSTWEQVSEPEQLFTSLAYEVAAAVAEHDEYYAEGLITHAEASWKLLRDSAEKLRWSSSVPAARVDLGPFEPLRDAVLASSRASPIVAVIGPPGSGRTTLARQVMAELRETPAFTDWGFNLDNFHGAFVDPDEAPALLALSHRCVASYAIEDQELEISEAIVRSVLDRSEDARLILRGNADAFAALAQRQPRLASVPVIEVPRADRHARIAVLLAHMVALDDWFGVDWGLPEAIVLARQSESLDSLEEVVACAGQALASLCPAGAHALACARANRSLPDEWEFATKYAGAAHVRARELVASPAWRRLRAPRCRRIARRFAEEQPEFHAQLVTIATSLQLRPQ